MEIASVAQEKIVLSCAVSERLADTITPVSAYMMLCGGSPDSFLLESVESCGEEGRFSIVACDPVLELQLDGDGVTLSGNRANGLPDPAAPAQHFFDVLRRTLASIEVVGSPSCPCVGSLMGFIGYDCVRLVEHLPGPIPSHPPAARLVLPSSYVVFDNVQRKMTVVALDRDAGAAGARLDVIEDLLSRPHSIRTSQGTGGSTLSCPTRDSFSAAVNSAKELILDGEIFQVVLSDSFEGASPLEPFDAYRRLRMGSPSPYMFFIDFGTYQIAGSSPEPLVKVDESGRVMIRPIAGTRGRSLSRKRDQELEAELVTSDKEGAEHLMLVDLARNDLGRIAEYGSVKVDPYREVERFSHVMHLVSEVTGTLRDDADIIDAFLAGFPAGTVSGAPKLRAMQIIDRLESGGRGPYAGAVGYFGPGAVMDTCIAIRIILFAGGRFTVRVGAGVVADSVPEHEYRELENKAAQSLEALGIALEERR